MKKPLFLFVLILVSFFKLRAQQTGNLDSSFGVNGKAIHRLHEKAKVANSIGHRAYIDLTNRLIVLAQFVDSSGQYRYCINALQPNGNFDSTFGINGTIYLRKTKYILNYAVSHFGFDSLNGILLAFEHNLFRFNPNGTEDTLFGLDGRVITPGRLVPATSNSFTTKVFLRPNNKFILIFDTLVGLDKIRNIGLIQFNINGTPDTSFHQGLPVLKKFRPNNQPNTNAGLVSLRDGSMVIAGYCYNGVSDDLALLKVLPNGETDSSFGTSGSQVYDFFQGQDRAISIFPAYRNGFLVLGSIAPAPNSTYYPIYALRFKENGVLDSLYGQNGRIEANVPSNGLLFDAPNQSIMVTTMGAILRFLSNGQRDSSFGVQGSVTPGKNLKAPMYDWVYCVYSPQRFCFIGSKKINSNSLISVLFTDTSGNYLPFSAKDMCQVLQPAPYLTSAALLPCLIGKPALQHSGILVPVSYLNDGRYFMKVLRFHENGSIDSSYESRSLNNISGVIHSSISTQDGSTYFAGYRTIYDLHYPFICKLNSNGTPDLNFGNNGTITFSKDTGSTFYDLDLFPNQSILLTGSFLCRIKPNGFMDSSFAQNGLYKIRGGSNAIITKQGSILVVADSLLYKLHSNGQIDISFANKGIYKEIFNASCGMGYWPQFHRGLFDLIENYDESILVYGRTFAQYNINCYNSSNNHQVKKLHANGQLNTTFASNGTLQLGVHNDRLNLLFLKGLGDNFILYEATPNYFNLRKYLADGKADSSYGTFGSRLFASEVYAAGFNIQQGCVKQDSSSLTFVYAKNDSILFSRHLIKNDERVQILANGKTKGMITDTFSLMAQPSSGIVNLRWVIPNAIYVSGTDSTSAQPKFIFTEGGYKTIQLWGLTVNGKWISTTESNFIRATAMAINLTHTVVEPTEIVQLFPSIVPFPDSVKWRFHRPVKFENGYSQFSIYPLFTTGDTGAYSFSLVAFYGSNDSTFIHAPNLLNAYNLTIRINPSFVFLHSFGSAKATTQLPANFVWQTKGNANIFRHLGDSCVIGSSDTGWVTLVCKAIFLNKDTLTKTLSNALYFYADPSDLLVKANFSSTKVIGFVNDTFLFENFSSGPFNSQTWNVTPNTFKFISGDNRSKNIQVSFSSPGKYNIELKVENPFNRDSLLRPNYIEIQTAIGQAEYHSVDPIVVFPNPSSGKLCISGLNDKYEYYALMNTSGKILESSTIQSIGNTVIEVVLSGNYTPGLYLLKLSSDVTDKIIKIQLKEE